MAYTDTKDGYNMYDMISMLQKAIRRSDYEHAGFAADQVSGKFRKVMWNRLLIVTAEDCYGILTKEIVALKEKDDEMPNNKNVADAVALECRSLKSRDACYFSCNFVMASRKTRDIEVDEKYVRYLEGLISRIRKDRKMETDYDESGFQLSIFGSVPGLERIEHVEEAAKLEVALRHCDMDMIGWHMAELIRKDRELIWDLFTLLAEETECYEEVKALRTADSIFNASKREKNEIFTSKAAMILAGWMIGEDLQSVSIIDSKKLIDWSQYKVKPIADCKLKNRKVPEWVYDCHTIRGKQMGKTDWDMTNDEQEALNPKKKMFFDDASWYWTYEQDWENGDLSKELWDVICENAKTHSVNPVVPIPYE